MARQPETLVEKLFRSEYEKLRAVAASVLCDSDLAEDCVQKAFCVALLNEKELNAHPNPQGWIMQTVRFTALDALRKRERYNKRILSLDREVADDLAEDPFDDTPDSGELLERIRSALKPEDYLLLMRTAETGSRGKEIATEFGLSVNAYYKRLERIRKRVKKILEFGRKNKNIFLFLCQILALSAIYK